MKNSLFSFHLALGSSPLLRKVCDQIAEIETKHQDYKKLSEMFGVDIKCEIQKELLLAGATKEQINNVLK